jgi:hypothetical protein
MTSKFVKITTIVFDANLAYCPSEILRKKNYQLFSLVIFGVEYTGTHVVNYHSAILWFWIRIK